MAKLSELLAFRKPPKITVEEYLSKLMAKGLNPDGSPKLDPVPMAPPIGYKRQPSMVEIVRDMVRGENLRRAALEAGAETFEESEDFDVGDDPPQLRSPYENDQDPSLQDLLAAGADAQAAKKSNLPPAPEGKGEGGKASGSPDKPAPNPPPEPPKGE